MTRLFFIEGPIQTGKSTLIRDVLGEHLAACGGFTSQRLIDSAGDTRGFRIGPAASTPLTAPLAGMRPGPAAVNPLLEDSADYDAIPAFAAPNLLSTHLLTAPNGSIYPGVFKYFDPAGRVHTDQEVFDILGVQYLLPKRGCPLMLLDEIGGSELLCPLFRQALYKLLDSGIPCLGVLKLADSARHMQKRSYAPDPESGKTIADYNEELRARIAEDPEGQVLYFERGTPSEAEVRKRLQEFVRGIF